MRDDFYIGHKEEFSTACVLCRLDERASIFIRGKTTFPSDRVLHKEYDCKSSAKKKSLVVTLKGLDAKAN
jgi:hypothetical protein